MTIEAYIGANNQTKQLEIDKIVRILRRNHEGFTLKGVVTGYWRGEKEDTAVVLLSDNARAIAKTIAELKQELSQEAIATMQVSDMSFV